MTRPHFPHPRLARRLTLTCVLAAMASAPLLPFGTATADPIGSARERAAALRAQVDTLQTQAEVATERYNAAETSLGQAVTERLSAQQALEDAQRGAQDGVDRVSSRVRAIYMAGGQAALLASVLDGGDLNDVLNRYRTVQNIVSADETGAWAAQRRAESAAAVAARLDAIAARVTRLQVAASRAASDVRGLLDRQQALLAAADADVTRLVAEQQAAAAAASAQAFAAALAAARGAAGLSGTTAASPAATAAIAAARTRLGLPYVWGATGPDTFDCSGLTQWAYAAAGIALPRVAADQYNAGSHPSLAALAPGDLLFWATDPADPTTIHHVAIYLGGDLMLAAPHTGDVVKIQPVYLDGFVGATRPAPAG